MPATTSNRCTRIGSTSSGPQNFHRGRTNSERTEILTSASGRPGSGLSPKLPTALGPLSTIFEFELFGTGVDAGQTTFRLRHAYGELGQFGAGQTWSPFMDIDVFPNSVEYWGPTGMVFFRNVQFRWMPVKGDSRITLALERPGASADQGRYADRIELQDVRAALPDAGISGRGAAWQKVGLCRGGAEFCGELSGRTSVQISSISRAEFGDGVSTLSSNLKVHKDNVIKLQLVYGKGVQNYMNDAPADIGAVPNPGNARTPLTGKPIPLLGIVAFYDHYWSQKWSSTIGYSRLDTDNTSGPGRQRFQDLDNMPSQICCITP